MVAVTRGRSKPTDTPRVASVLLVLTGMLLGLLLGQILPTAPGNAIQPISGRVAKVSQGADSVCLDTNGGRVCQAVALPVGTEVPPIGTHVEAGALEVPVRTKPGEGRGTMTVFVYMHPRD